MVIYCGLNIELHCFHVYVCQCWPQTLATIRRNMGIWDVFMLHPPRKIYLGFVAFAGTVHTRSDSNLAPYVTPLLTHCGDETINRVRLSHSLARCQLERSNFELKDCFVYARQHGTWNSLGRTSAWAIFPRSRLCDYLEESDWPTATSATTRSKQFI